MERNHDNSRNPGRLSVLAARIRAPLALSAVLLLTIALVGRSAGAADSECRQHDLSYVVHESDGSTAGRLEIRIQKPPGSNHRWIEQRWSIDGTRESFDVVYDPDTFVPAAYTRQITDGRSRETIRIAVSERDVRGEIERPGKSVKRISTRIPDGPWMVEPFMKAYLSAAAEAGNTSGTFTLIAYRDGSFQTIESRWRIAGRDRIAVDAGSYDCLRVELKPLNWYLQVLDLTSTLWLDRRGACPIVRTPVRRGFFDDAKTMELVDAQEGPCTPDPPPE